MTNDGFLSAGLLAGFSIAVPIGPMGLLCIQRTMASGMGIGMCTGLGAATMNVIYGAIILFGAGQLAPWIGSGSRVLGALGGLFLLYSAARTWHCQGTLQPAARPVSSPLAAYASAVAFNAANPMGPMLILALASPLLGRASLSVAEVTIVLVGMFIAAATWWLVLSGGVALLRSRLSPRMLAYINQAAGLVLSGYGLVALASALRR